MSESIKIPLDAFLEGGEDFTPATDLFADMSFPVPEPVATPVMVSRSIESCDGHIKHIRINTRHFFC